MPLGLQRLIIVFVGVAGGGEQITSPAQGGRECQTLTDKGRGHNTVLRRRIVKIYDAAQRIVEISDAI